MRGELFMGIGDIFNLKKNIRELMIARPDDAKNHIIYKHPDPTIPMYSQATIEADEVAIFFKDGKAEGKLEAGRHTLKSENFPFLSNFVDSYTGGNVFISELYFVSIREFPGFKFGGKIGKVQDPKSGIPVELLVHGEFSMRVDNPEQLLLGLVGLRSVDNEAFAKWFKQQVLKVIRDRIGELITKNKWPLLDVTSAAYTEEIEEDVIKGVRKHVDPYGINIVRLGNFVISMKDEDDANLTKLYTDAAYVNMAGGMQEYQQFAAGKAMMGAGEGMAKGGGEGSGEGGGAVLGGAGLGVGFGMAQMFGNQLASQQQQAQSQQTGVQQVAGQNQPVQSEGIVCPSCNNTVTPGKFCASCGKPLEVVKKFCSNCGGELSADAKFCSKCGQKTE